jgi:hypothetical protein
LFGNKKREPYLPMLRCLHQTSNTWEEQRKMDSMRRVYQRAISIPLNNVEHLWKEYDQWENGLNRLTVSERDSGVNANVKLTYFHCRLRTF